MPKPETLPADILQRLERLQTATRNMPGLESEIDFLERRLKHGDMSAAYLGIRTAVEALLRHAIRVEQLPKEDKPAPEEKPKEENPKTEECNKGEPIICIPSPRRRIIDRNEKRTSPPQHNHGYGKNRSQSKDWTIPPRARARFNIALVLRDGGNPMQKRKKNNAESKCGHQITGTLRM